MNFDKTETIDGSLVQHGKYSDRVYLMKTGLRDPAATLRELDSLANAKEYGKIFAKAPRTLEAVFKKNGYRQEAAVPGLFEGSEDGLFFAKYFRKERAVDSFAERVNEILNITENKPVQGFNPALPDKYTLCLAKPSDITEMISVYRRVFDSYPFPIYDPGYLLKTMNDNVRYYCVRRGRAVIAASSAEIDFSAKNAEMTDFATLPEHRRQGIARWLLSRMEAETAARGVKVAYTIARALSPGMNIAFKTAGYGYAGTLTNNTNISGKIESMNVWYKRIS